MTQYTNERLIAAACERCFEALQDLKKVRRMVAQDKSPGELEPVIKLAMAGLKDSMFNIAGWVNVQAARALAERAKAEQEARDGKSS